MPRTGSTLVPDRERDCDDLVTELLVRCGKGDETALAALFDLFHPVASSLAVAHAADREVTDVVHAAFSRLWRRAAAFDPAAQNGISWTYAELSTAVASHAGSRSAGRRSDVAPAKSPRAAERVPSRFARARPSALELVDR